jgi:hypothetical protein
VVRGLRASWIAIVCVAVAAACSGNAAPARTPVGAHDEADPVLFNSVLVNPLRGQFENLLTPLFPQSNPVQAGFPAWPGTADVNARIDWRLLQPRDPRLLPPGAPDDLRFDFSQLDQAIEAAASKGRRFGFRVTAFNSCCEPSYPNNVDISVPDWLRSISGATQSFSHDGVAYIIPDWNSAAYLSYFSDLLAALGRRYDKDERVAIFEMSGYGDFSENHVSFMRDDLDHPGPGPDDSQDKLGYFSQYREQYITKASIDRLVTANLSAFPNTQMITSMDNPEIVRQLFRENPLLPSLRKPVGIRADGLGVYRPIPTWAENPASHYVQIHDPVVDTVANRFRIAPIVTEWMPQPSTDDVAATRYYTKGLRDVVNDHVSMTASTGFPGQTSDTKMPAALFDIWSRANEFAGYRYTVTGPHESPTVGSGTTLRIPLRWTNSGSAPAYEDWRPEYEILSAAGDVVETVRSSVDLGALVADQKLTRPEDVPAWKTVTDNLSVGGGLPRGSYAVRVRVVWYEHKQGAKHTVNFPPMELALPGRTSDGGYPVASFTVK